MAIGDGQPHGSNVVLRNSDGTFTIPVAKHSSATSTKRERFKEGRLSNTKAVASAVAPVRRGRRDLVPPTVAEMDGLRASLHLSETPVGDKDPGHTLPTPKRVKHNAEYQTEKKARLAKLKQVTE